MGGRGHRRQGNHSRHDASVNRSSAPDSSTRVSTRGCGRLAVARCQSWLSSIPVRARCAAHRLRVAPDAPSPTVHNAARLHMSAVALEGYNSLESRAMTIERNIAARHGEHSTTP
jgi:hypothetical protein